MDKESMDLSALREAYEERAAILEHDARMPRVIAEQLALEMTARAVGVSVEELKKLLDVQ